MGTAVPSLQSENDQTSFNKLFHTYSLSNGKYTN